MCSWDWMKVGFFYEKKQKLYHDLCMKSDHPNVFLCPNLPDLTNTWSPHLTESVKSLRLANSFGEHIKLKIYIS